MLKGTVGDTIKIADKAENTTDDTVVPGTRKLSITQNEDSAYLAQNSTNSSLSPQQLGVVTRKEDNTGLALKIADLSPNTQKHVEFMINKISTGNAHIFVDSNGSPKIKYDNEKTLTWDASNANRIAFSKSNIDMKVVEAWLEMACYIKSKRPPSGYVMDTEKVSVSKEKEYREGDEFVKTQEILGKGTCAGQVIVLKDKEKGQEHAYKTVMISVFRPDEIRCWVDLSQSDYFPSLYLFKLENNKVRMHMEKLVNAKSFSSIIDDHMTAIPWPEMKPFSLFVLDGALEAITEMHRRGWLHNDLHGGNVMLQKTPQNTLRVKILDFGRASKLEDEKKGIDYRGFKKDVLEVLRLFIASYTGLTFDNQYDLRKNWKSKLEEHTTKRTVADKEELFYLVENVMDVMHLDEMQAYRHKVKTKLRNAMGDEQSKQNVMETVIDIIFKEDVLKMMQRFYQAISDDLRRTVGFWLKFSHDTEYGGFFNYLDSSGKVYDETKHVWLQARQVWMYARLYNEEEQFRTPEILEIAIKGAEFIQKNAKDPETSKYCQSMTRDGKPIKYLSVTSEPDIIQHAIFSECYYTMAICELFRSTKEIKYKDEAVAMFDHIIDWVRKDWQEVRAGRRISVVNSLDVPMMLLCLLDQMETMDSTMTQKYADVADMSLKQVLSHLQRKGTIILENVSATGEELPGCAGRLTVPGHAIEAGWILLQYARKKENAELKKTAIEDFISKMFDYGWDSMYGGLFYFLDIDKYCPVQPEWNMKLWWTHSGSMIAFLMAYQETKDVQMLKKFETVFDYCYSKHVDKDNGEWTGYLNRDGTVCMDFKGGPWKGCFHVPRALLMCKQMLEEELKKK